MQQSEDQEDTGATPNASLCSTLMTTNAKAQEDVIRELPGIYFKGSSNRRRHRLPWTLVGVIIFSSVSAALLLRHDGGFSARCGSNTRMSCASTIGPWLVAALGVPRWRPNAILDYLHLYPLSTLTHSSNISSLGHEASHHNKSKDDNRIKQSRHLLGGDSNTVSYPQLVVAGKMTVEDGPCNIAQYNLKTEAWSLTERIQLSLYNSYSGGEVYSLLANHTFLPMVDSEDGDDSSTRR